MIRRAFSREAGSVILLTLFICLAAAVVLQAAGTAIICAQHAVVDEEIGRQRLEDKNRVLGTLREQSTRRWLPIGWTDLGCGQGMTELPSEGEDWLLWARARQDPSLSMGETSVLMERGRDGLDLPKAAMVAEDVTADGGRTTPWVTVEENNGAAGSPETGDVGCYFLDPPESPALGSGLEAVGMADRWRLSPGWAVPLSDVAGSAPGIGHCDRIAFLTGRAGLVETVPEACRGGEPSDPALVVMTGGGTLDARDMGDFWGVLVADGGSLMLDGTSVHGAVFVSETLALGANGRVSYNRDIWRWATDRALSRTRLVPGTRWEAGMD